MLITMENSGLDPGDNVRFGVSILKLQQFQEVSATRRNIKSKSKLMESPDSRQWKLEKIKTGRKEIKNVIMTWKKNDEELIFSKEHEPSKTYLVFRMRDGKEKLSTVESMSHFLNETIITDALGFKITAIFQIYTECEDFVGAVRRHNQELDRIRRDVDLGLPNDGESSSSNTTPSCSDSFSSGSLSLGANVPQPPDLDA